MNISLQYNIPEKKKPHSWVWPNDLRSKQPLPEPLVREPSGDGRLIVFSQANADGKRVPLCTPEKLKLALINLGADCTGFRLILQGDAPLNTIGAYEQLAPFVKVAVKAWVDVIIQMQYPYPWSYDSIQRRKEVLDNMKRDGVGGLKIYGTKYLTEQVSLAPENDAAILDAAFVEHAKYTFGAMRVSIDVKEQKPRQFVSSD